MEITINTSTSTISEAVTAIRTIALYIEQETYKIQNMRRSKFDFGIRMNDTVEGTVSIRKKL